jgi:hypothetical protein
VNDSNITPSPALPGTTEFAELIELIPESLREKAISGDYEILEGQNTLKPVVRDVNTKRLVKGSGRYPKANDLGEISKKYGYKRSAGYREALETIVSLEGDARGSFSWLYEQAMDAAEGSPQLVTCTSCGDRFQHAFKKDGTLIFKLIELMAGKAKETSEINTETRHIVEMLNERIPIKAIEVNAVDPQEARRRREALMEDNNDTLT